MSVNQHHGRRPASRQADVAREAGVSQATVSAVVNGRATESGIAPATAERVLKVARKLEYVPNAAARSLKGKGNRVLGVHTFEAVFPISQRDFYHDFLIGIEEQAVADGYDLMLFTSTEGDDGKRKIYRDGANRLRAADASILVGVDPDLDDMAKLYEGGYPFVFIGRREIPGVPIPYVSADYFSATAHIVDRLAELGHRCIGYVGTLRSWEPQRDREAGFLAGCERNGVRALEPKRSAVADLYGQWLSDVVAAGATALLIEDYKEVPQVRDLARLNKISIPDDLSVAVLGAAPGGGPGPARWSSFGIPRKEMGRAAVRMLVEMLTDPDAERDHHMLLPCSPPSDSTMIAAPRTPN